MDLTIEEQIQSTNKAVTQQDNYSKAQVNTGNSSSSSTSTPKFEGSEGYSDAIENSARQVEKKQPVTVDPKIGRNDPCPCGSGKKFKQCHGK